MKNTFKKLFISFTVLSLTACSSTTMQDNTFAAKENKGCKRTLYEMCTNK